MSFEFQEQIGTLKFEKETYNFRMTDGITHSFLQNRLYAHLDYFLMGDSKQILDKYVKEEIYNKAFILTISDIGNSPIEMVCRIFPDENSDVVRMDFCKSDSLQLLHDNMRLELQEKTALIAQHSDVFFKYDAIEDIISIGQYTEGASEELYKASLDELESRVRQEIKANAYDSFDRFIFDLRIGTRCFTTCLEKTDGTELNLSASALYNGAVHIMTVGRIGGQGMPLGQLNLYDPLTGTFLKNNILDYARYRISSNKLRTALAIIDVDDFKLIDDNFGHQKGDEVMRTIASLITKSFESLGKVGRIGGDEFLVVFDNFSNLQEIKYAMMGLQSLASAEYKEPRDGFKVTFSVGCTVYPDDYNGTFEEMFRLCDQFLYRAKDKGKNRYIVYNPKIHGDAERILHYGFVKPELNKSEFICELVNSRITGENIDIDNLVENIGKFFGIERVVLYNKTDRNVLAQHGINELSPEIVSQTIGYLYDKGLLGRYTGDYLRINSIEYFKHHVPSVYELLVKQNTTALLQFEIEAKNGKRYVLSLEKTTGICAWNTGNLPYYRILNRILEDIL